MWVPTRDREGVGVQAAVILGTWREEVRKGLVFKDMERGAGEGARRWHRQRGVK